ncbi:MAG: single-stranded DNA-binding protein [Candidatus Saccharibacteria bacterium]|nr:single-stranded DNA-binding protein [Candidatus Saccharibacteria bacterium]
MGNLTRDPELRTTPNGQSVCAFSIAVNRTWKNAQGEQQESVDYIDCNAWAKGGEIIAQYMQKGGAILVSGRLQQRSWEQDGQKRSKVEVVVEDFNFVGGGSGGGSNSGSSSGYDKSSNNSSSGAAPGSDSSSGKSGSGKNGKKKDDVVIEDIGDEPINLDDIPF